MPPATEPRLLIVAVVAAWTVMPRSPAAMLLLVPVLTVTLPAVLCAEMPWPALLLMSPFGFGVVPSPLLTMTLPADVAWIPLPTLQTLLLLLLTVTGPDVLVAEMPTPEIRLLEEPSSPVLVMFIAAVEFVAPMPATVIWPPVTPMSPAFVMSTVLEPWAKTP